MALHIWKSSKGTVSR